jgi:tRNA (uracil-5-)-methyltransferase
MKIVQEVKAKFRNLEKEARRHKNREVVPMYDWVKEKRAIEVLQILPSPKITEYRNKCELIFGYHLKLDTSQMNDGESTREGTNEEDGVVMRKIPCWSGGVSRPHILANIPSEACAIMDILEEFLATSSIPPYDSYEHKGMWRMLIIRISECTRECMLIIMHAPPSSGIGANDDTDDYTDVFESKKACLLSMLVGRDLLIPERQYKMDATGAEDTKEPAEAQSLPSPI